MSQLEKFMKWCFDRGEEGEKHSGLKEVEPSVEIAREHIDKAKHYLDATLYLRKKFSDVAVTQAFYVIYHCLLAILAKHGYESRNQRCTFAAIEFLIEEGKIDLDIEKIRKIATYDTKKAREEEVIALREEFQYGVETKVEKDKLDILIDDAKEYIGDFAELDKLIDKYAQYDYMFVSIYTWKGDIYRRKVDFIS